MRIGFISYDTGPSKMNSLIERAVKKVGHSTVFLPSSVRLSDQNYESLVCCDIVVVGGVASFKTHYDVVVIEELIKMDKSYVIVEDMPTSSMRPRMPQELAKAKVVFAAMPQYVADIKNFGYKRVEYIGPPSHWKKLYEIMVSADNIRNSLTKEKGRQVLAVTENDKILFLCGIKDAVLNNKILKLMDDIGKKTFGDNFVLGFKSHPGEPRDDNALSERKELFSSNWILNIGEANVPELVVASNIPVFTGGSTDALMSAYARIPTIYCTSQEIRERNKLQSRIPTHGEYFVADLGGCLVADIDVDGTFERMVNQITTQQDNFDYLCRLQKENFQIPNNWDTAEKIVKYLESM